MSELLTMQDLANGHLDIKALGEAANGDENTIVTTRTGNTYPSAKKAISEGIITLFENGGLPATPFTTKALMTASALVNGDYAMVTDDAANNGLYTKTAGAWVKSTYDPLTQSKAYTDVATKDVIKAEAGVNIFNKAEVTTDRAINHLGDQFYAAGFSASSFTPILPNKTYTSTGINTLIVYNSSKDMVARYTAAGTFTTEANAAFIRLDVLTSKLSAVQVELGSSATPVQDYKMGLPLNSIVSAQIATGGVQSRNILELSVTGEHLADAIWLNMVDPTRIVNKSLDITTGKEVSVGANSSTHFIPVKPNTVYTVGDANWTCFYTKDKKYIGYYNATKTMTTPENCHYVRISIANVALFRAQFNEGATIVPQGERPLPYKYTMPSLYVAPSHLQLSDAHQRKYSFADAWVAWRSGEKFPICFLGDSTTEGYGTTGHTTRSASDFNLDYIAPNSYTSVFQALVREATGNSAMRAYNAGFVGQNSLFARDNLDAIFGGVFADSKLVGIAHGINDRVGGFSVHASFFKARTEAIIRKLITKGYQPFMVTTQPITIPSQVSSSGSAAVVEASNAIKISLANKYNLEVIDVNTYAEQFMQYSTKPLLNNIMESGGNTIHFGDAGHKYTAELMFAHFCTRTIWVDKSARLDFSTQRIKSDIDLTYLTQLSSFKEGFKLEVNKSHANATNKLYQEFFIFNSGQNQLKLTAHRASTTTGQYVKLNGVDTIVTTAAQEIGTLDLGLHKIAAYSSATTALDWLGFKLTPTV